MSAYVIFIRETTTDQAQVQQYVQKAPARAWYNKSGL